ncbi:hypothetical protein [Roseomonas sp. 18066]|uniref:hypothetical protein n=1 Tax=Roseomonas sp. 18066 TaxID=2681412 RepID=UPI00190F0C8D|nr:hypothetical protein [Roseomonas sp. 18066]
MPRVIWSMLFSIAVRVCAALVAIVLVANPAAGAAVGSGPGGMSSVAAAGAVSGRGAASTAATPWLITSATALASAATVSATAVLAAANAGAGSFGSAARTAGFSFSVPGLIIFGAFAMQLFLLSGPTGPAGFIRGRAGRHSSGFASQGRTGAARCQT